MKKLHQDYLVFSVKKNLTLALKKTTKNLSDLFRMIQIISIELSQYFTSFYDLSWSSKLWKRFTSNVSKFISVTIIHLSSKIIYFIIYLGMIWNVCC